MKSRRGTKTTKEGGGKRGQLREEASVRGRNTWGDMLSGHNEQL